ncbi:preprotein translocase subunit SecE [Candidatus Pacebacteria bacterium]|nr:preprotein translocase subunit SecE [Candidatus Paceibacterota bacterium]
MGIINYIRETKGEMKHISWPTRRQTTVFTIIIVIVSLFIAAYLGLFDWIFTGILEQILR